MKKFDILYGDRVCSTPGMSGRGTDCGFVREIYPTDESVWVGVIFDNGSSGTYNYTQMYLISRKAKRRWRRS